MELKYTVEDKTIAYLLGINNFTNSESAVLELVKNAYDANATHLTLKFGEDELTVSDDGCGMNADDIEKIWMHVGKRHKEYSITDANNQERVLAGFKGVGRFALARLGEGARLYSQKKDSEGILWETDWNISRLEVVPRKEEFGTRIVISKLRDKWTKRQVEKLCNFLSKTYNDQKMQIKISHPDVEKNVPQYFSMPKVGQNCLSMIQLKYHSKQKKLSVEITSDEFSNDAKVYCKGINLNEKHISIDMVSQLKTLVAGELTESDLAGYLEELGDFSAIFHFYIKQTSEDAEKFFYKHLGFQEALPSGVILYRNAFSISAYEGKKDWLGFGARARKSPAAATHPTGSWVVRENQIGGRVDIDRQQNFGLEDLSNRQGLEENTYYQLFIEIILTGIKEFERYRQNIIRCIDKKNKSSILPEMSLIDKVIKDHELPKKLSKEANEEFIAEIEKLKQEIKKGYQKKDDVEIRYKYDVHILNVLATMSLKAASIAHEIRNDRNSVAVNTQYIIDALVAYGMWDDLNSPEKTAKVYRNVPYLLKSNSEINAKIISFMSTMLSEIKKKRFKPVLQSIDVILEEIKSIWENDYKWIDISIERAESISFFTSKDTIQVILDNLILNSIQQNAKAKHLDINIKIRHIGDYLLFEYSDNGKGLDKKYSSNPRKILEPHETTRKDGHGLGMWILNNTVVMSGGEVQNISEAPGFSIEFTIGSEG